MTKEQIIEILDKTRCFPVPLRLLEKVADEILALQPTDKDIEAWAELNIPYRDNQEYAMEGAKAMRDGKIKHKDNG